MVKTTKVGYGITKREQRTYRISREGLAEFVRDAEGKIYPLADFPGWLDWLSETVALRAKELEFPTESMLRAQPYQSEAWYLKEINQAIFMTREAIKAGDAMKLAARALMLGSINREYKLKFSGEKRLAEYEASSLRQVNGVDMANAKKVASAEEWKKTARRLQAAITHIETGHGYKSKMAEAILCSWPHGSKPPSLDRLRRFL